MCRADLTERAAEEKDMLVLAKEEENIVVNKPALSQIRSICELATLECYYHNVEKSAKAKKQGGLMGRMAIGTCGRKRKKFWIEYTGVAKTEIDMSDVNMKDNRNRYNEEIEKYQSMDQFQVGIAVFDPDTTETQFYDNVRSVCEMMNNNISISVGVTWAEHGKEFNEKIMEADWRMYEQKNAYHQQQQAAQQELLQ